MEQLYFIYEFHIWNNRVYSWVDKCYMLCYLPVYLISTMHLIIYEFHIYNMHACWLLLCMSYGSFILCCSMFLDQCMWIFHTSLLFKLDKKSN
jgi:hypothetical protein